MLRRLLFVPALLAIAIAQQPAELLGPIGILEIPEPVVLRVNPDPSAEVVGKATLADLVDAEYSYEASGAVVYERKDRWFHVRLKVGDSGWAYAPPSQTFHPLESLVINGLARLNPNWDGALYKGPGVRRFEARGTKSGREVAIEVDRAEWERGKLWFHVEVLRASPCEEANPSVIARGWVEAHNKDGKPVVWFYSRGC